MKFVSRKEWGARSPRYSYKAELSSPSTGHWNGPTITVGGKTIWDHTKCAGLVRGIQNFHMDDKGWSDIAYNFVECPHGYTFEGRGINVINGANGTNAGNRTSHAIMALAGEGNPFTDNEKIGFKSCVSYISDLSEAPNVAIGHRDHKSTECPGNARYSWIHNGMPIPQQKAELIMFHPNTDYRLVVRDAYNKIVGRQPESQEVLDTWAWVVGAEQGLGYAKLNHGLLYEQRLREEAKLNNLAKQISASTPVGSFELTEEAVQDILARVYADLTEKINS